MKAMFTVAGKVVKGKSRGKALGFPTANLVASPTLPQGIYLSTTEIDGIFYQSVTFIGTVDTYGESDFVVETFILNFDQDIYGKFVKVNILKKLRENQKFESVEKLIAQIEKDVKQARDYFSKNKLFQLY